MKWPTVLTLSSELMYQERSRSSRWLELLTRTTLRCRRAYVLPLGFSFFFSTPNLWGHWMDLDQTRTHIHLWLLFEKFGLNSPGHLPPTGWGKKTLIWDNVRKETSIYRDSLTCPLNLVNLTAENGWQVFAQPPKFLHWETASLTA